MVNIVKLAFLSIIYIVGLPFNRFLVNADRSLYHPCVRTCVENATMSCHYHFTVEHYVTMGKACQYCWPTIKRPQLLDTPNCQCVLADGFERGILTINRMLPGPSIQVCKGDTIIVDVHNHMDGHSTAFHWHGIHQRGYQYFDGVPFVTQCPILGGTSFRYIFKANTVGTHFYHSHTNVQVVDGLYGSLIVREPVQEDINRNLYDKDLPEHVMLVSDFIHRMGAELIPGYSYSGNRQYPESFLINGLGRHQNPQTGKESTTPYEIFNVEAGKRYRFRLINSIGTSCEARLTIQNHPLTIVSSDGENFEPFTVDSLVFFPGERFDMIVNANRAPGIYWIQVISPKGCQPTSVHQLAMLRYEGYFAFPVSPKPTYKTGLPEGKAYVDVCRFRMNRVCVTDLRSREKSKFDIVKAVPNRTVLLPYHVMAYESGMEVFGPNTYRHFLAAPKNVPITSALDGISFVFPPIPPLSQPDDVKHDTLCDSTMSVNKIFCSETACNCPHTLHFNLGDIVELVLADFSKDIEAMLPHPYHLHGNSFYIMATGELEPREGEYSMMDIWPVWNKYRMQLESGKIIRPAKKDTLLIPRNGYAILRVKLDNPGYWFFHCHFAYHTAIGMSLILHVGNQTHLPPVPENFPKCGHFLPT